MHATPHQGRARRSIGLTAASAMTLALLPATMAGAQDADAQSARDISTVCDGDYESSFADVQGNVHEDAILCAADYAIAAGYSEDAFGPGDLVRRDQMATFVTNWVEQATGHVLPAEDGGFDDVDAGSTHAESIDKLTTAGIVRGFDEDTYGPSVPVERDQMASFIAFALSYIDDGVADNGSAPPAPSDSYFADIDGNAHEVAINALAEQGIVTGYDSDTYGPHDGVRRDQMPSFIMRGYDYAVDAGLAVLGIEVAVDQPTADDPVAIEQGAEFEVAFTTSHECDFSLDMRPTGSDDPDAWQILGQGVAEAGESLHLVEMHEDAVPGDTDLRLTCFTQVHSEHTTEVAAIEVLEASDDA